MNAFMACAVLAVGLFAVACGGDDGDDSSGDTGGPAAPSELSLTEQGGGVMLAWKDNSANEDHFMVMRKVGTARFETIGTPMTTEYLDTEVTSGTTYIYHVMAMAGSELSAASNEVTFTAP